MLKVPEIEPGIGNIVTVDSFCVQDPTSPDGQKCTLTIQDNVEGRCTHYDDIGLNCREGTGMVHVLEIYTFIHSYIHLFIHSIIHSFNHSFIHSFNHSYLHAS